jgi:glucose-1-phosphate cytidylyltransferase
MKVVLFCGGKGTRWTGNGDEGPKVLARIGDRPIIWHVMSIYSVSGFNDFILCLGYKANHIVRYFEDVSYGRDQETGALLVRPHAGVVWRVHLEDTGADTSTGGRLRAVGRLLGGDRFLCSYGDGLADLDIASLISFHDEHTRLATLTAVRPRSQFGILQLDGAGRVESFIEKPRLQDWINGGFFVFEPEVLHRLDDGPLEEGPLEGLARDGELIAYCSNGFWACLDTYKDMLVLNEIWQKGDTPWSSWTRKAHQLSGATAASS